MEFIESTEGKDKYHLTLGRTSGGGGGGGGGLPPPPP